LPLLSSVFSYWLFADPYPSQKNAGRFHLCFTRHCFFSERSGYGFISARKLDGIQLTTPEFLSINPLDQAIVWQTYFWVYVFAASIGFATALAEPALLAVAIKAEHISGGTIRAWGLRIAVAIGVGFGLALGLSEFHGDRALLFIVAGYIIVILQTLFAPKSIIGLACDSGGVTTSMVTVPLVTALGLGLAQAIPGRNPVLDGFGLIAFASLFPIIAVLGYAQIAQWLNKSRISSKS